MSSLQNLDTLLNDVVTVADRQAFLSSLEHSSDSLFKQDGVKSLPETLVIFLKANQVDLNDPELVKDFLEIIKDQVRALPQVGLTCAQDWSDSSRQRLLDWFQKSLGHRVVLDLTVDKNLIGGAVVEFTGVRRDFSVQTKLRGVNLTVCG